MKRKNSFDIIDPNSASRCSSCRKDILFKLKDQKLYSSKNLSYEDRASDGLFFENQIWRIKEVADYLGCSIKHVYNLTSRGEIPHRKKGKFLFFIPTEILNWIQEGE